MTPTKVVSREDWLKARLALLDKEKAHSKARDALTRERMALPWVKLEKEYVFDGPGGNVSLADLFGDKSQLIVYHFMYDADWDEGCKSCSFSADFYDRAVVHLAHRDVALVTVSIAPLEKLQAFKQRMGWTFPWVSSANNSFNRDYHVTFTEEEMDGKAYHNFRENVTFPSREAPGVSVFARDDHGTVHHTYSAYGRGLENLMHTYQLLDLVPKGRDEDDLDYSMDWLRLRDSYESD